MHRLTFIAALVATASLGTAFGQVHGDVFAGYSFLHTDGANTHGWNASFAPEVTDRLDLVMDAAGHYGSEDVGGTPVDVDTHSLLFGLRYGSPKRTPVRPFVHVLAGLLRVGVGVSVLGVSVSDAEWGFSLGGGGGVDLRLSDRLALRLVQADYLSAWIAEERGDLFRLSTGLVIRF